MKRSIALAAALVGPLLAGVGMSYGQTVSPDGLAPLFNSATPVAAIAVVAALAGRRWWHFVALAAAAGPLTMAGYYGTAALRGFGVSSTWLVFWCTAGVAVGAVIGAAVWRLRSRASGPTSPVWRGLAASAWPGIALGEGAHGLLRVSDSTPVGYWWCQVALGLAVLAWLGATRVRSWAGVASAALGTLVLGVGLYLSYGAL